QHGSVFWKHGAEQILKTLNFRETLFNQLQELAMRTGSVGCERFTGPQIFKKYRKERHIYDSTEHISLISSFLCSVFCGCYASVDFGDASGTNLFNIATFKWDDHCVNGFIADYFVKRYGFSPACSVIVFTGDNHFLLKSWMNFFEKLLCKLQDSIFGCSLSKFRLFGKMEMVHELTYGHYAVAKHGIYFDELETSCSIKPGYYRFNVDGKLLQSFASNVEARAILEHQCLSKRMSLENVCLTDKNVFNLPVYKIKTAHSAALGGCARAISIIPLLSSVFKFCDCNSNMKCNFDLAVEIEMLRESDSSAMGSDLFGEVEEKFERLKNIWDNLGFTDAEREDRLKTTINHLKLVLDRMIDEEEETLHLAVESIEKNKIVINALELELNEPVEPNISEKLPLLDKEHYYRKRAEYLASEKDQRLERRSRIMEELKMACYRLGMNSPSSKPSLRLDDLNHLESELSSKKTILDQRISLVTSYMTKIQTLAHVMAYHGEDLFERNIIERGDGGPEYTEEMVKRVKLFYEKLSMQYEVFLEEAKKRNEEKLSELTIYWEKCKISQNERNCFLQSVEDKYSTDALALYDREIERLSTFYESRKCMFDLIEKWENLWKQKIDFEVRLEIQQALNEWNAENPTATFLYDGLPVLKKLEQIEAAYYEEKEKEKIEKTTSARKAAKAKTPSSDGGPLVTPRVSLRRTPVKRQFKELQSPLVFVKPTSPAVLASPPRKRNDENVPTSEQSVTLQSYGDFVADINVRGNAVASSFYQLQSSPRDDCQA
ncbi:xylulose kinase, partial [Trichinella spiralis]|uniref:xylulose kinase n=1 Tax=Trichinella spiralis TaxID=6334 RepID=UPI0001EFD044